MKARILFATFSLLALFAGADEKRPNVLLICVDDLRPELNCFGKDYIVSPNIDRLASEGRIFTRHFVQAPTCGASRFTLLTGRYGPDSNGALFARAKNIKHASMPAYLKSNGYTTVSVGKVSHHPGGRGGKDWNDDQTPEMPNSWDRHILDPGAWKHPRGWMHGLANSEIRVKAGEMDLIQALEGPDEIYPDGIMINDALAQLDQLKSGEKPFFLAVGILRPHLPFGAPAKYLEHYKNVKLPPIPHPEKPVGKTTWHGSGEFMKYNRWKRNPNTDAEFADDVRKHYAACVTYADAQVGKLLSRLDELKIRDNTIVILWGDHGWHLGEHAVWGKHTLFEESLRSPLIVSHPGIENPGVKTNSIVETLDIFPTVCDLVGLDKPDFLHGMSLKPLLENPELSGHTAVAYKSRNATIRDEKYRLIKHKDHYELYDQTADDVTNLASDLPEVVERLDKKLTERLALRSGD